MTRGRFQAICFQAISLGQKPARATLPESPPPTASTTGSSGPTLAAAAIVAVGLAGLLYAGSTHDRQWRDDRGIGPNY